MSYRLQIEENALAGAMRWLKDESEAVDDLLDFLDDLAADPAVATSFPWGPLYRRAHFGNWRVLYNVDDEQRVVYVEQIGRARDNNKK